MDKCKDGCMDIISAEWICSSNEEKQLYIPEISTILSWLVYWIPDTIVRSRWSGNRKEAGL
jgi:hypothetical protein